MAIPASAKRFTRPMDPKDRVKRRIGVSDPDTPLEEGEYPILSAGEEMVSPLLSLQPEFAFYGVEIPETGPYAPVYGGNFVTFWLQVSSSHWADAIYNGSGIEVAAELDFETNGNPPPRYQRTAAQRINNQ